VEPLACRAGKRRRIIVGLATALGAIDDARWTNFALNWHNGAEDGSRTHLDGLTIVVSEVGFAPLWCASVQPMSSPSGLSRSGLLSTSG
jgi:hypothetical protein